MPNAARRELNVLMISDVYFPRINGVSTSIETFRHDLAAAGIRVNLLVPDYPGSPRVDGIFRVPSRQLPFDPEDRLMRWGDLLRTARKEAQSRHFDLIHIQTPFAAHYAGVRLARELQVPVLATYHTHFEEYFHHYLPVLPRPWLRAAARSLARRQCNDYDAVIVPSRAMRETLTAYGVKRPLHILPTGIPQGMFSRGDRARFRATHGIGHEKLVALFVGRVAHEKNIGFLLEVTAHLRQRLPEFLLVIAGEGPALADLRSRAGAMGLGAHVQFIGYLDRHVELADCYAAADVFAFSSRTETQGLVLLEAMAAGLPVHALAEMGTRDILECQRGAVVAEDKVEAFAASLGDLLTDAGRRARLSEEARAWAAEWSAPERARQLAALYREVSHANRGVSPSATHLPVAVEAG